jgi:hypothetical protein
MDRKKRELLHQAQKILHDKVAFAPIWENGFIRGAPWRSRAELDFAFPLGAARTCVQNSALKGRRIFAPRRADMTTIATIRRWAPGWARRRERAVRACCGRPRAV